ncbi:hypothetical protein SUGI_1198920 [Cryptomeria japonica]|nr:hypothetical protein SUGI_1198920 [Cryptomeria japonica]
MILKWDPTTFQRWGELEEEDLYKMLYKDNEDDTQDHISLPCERYGKGFKILQKFGYDGKSPLGLRKEGIIEPLQPELTFKKERLKGLGFLTSKVHTQRIEEALQIKAAKIQQEDCYSTDSNEWEWGSDKSSSDYELTEIFREPDEPTEEEEFYNKFRVGQEIIHEDSTQSLSQVARLKSHRMRTPVLEYTTSDDNLDSFVIETDEESAIDDLNNYLDIPKYNCIFTLSPANFEDINDLPLVHHQLIDWDHEGPVQFDTFQNDEAFIDYLGIRDDLPPGDHKAGYTIELNSMAYFGEGVGPSSRKNVKIRTNQGSYDENHTVALSDPKKVKRKDISEGENLSEAPEDGRLNILPTSYEEKSSMLVEETIKTNIGTEEVPHNIFLAQSLTESEKSKFISFFKERQINFSWSYADMPGLDLDLIIRHLTVKLGAKPVKQKLRKMHPQVALLVKAELEKLLDVGFIRPIDYPEWISNLVPVSKPDRNIRICTDFRDINKACPKDDFPLPNIDLIVDLTEGHEMLSLMDGFSGYNQIRIAPEDQHKTSFTCPWGTFCWNVMPFGLKNAGATYQRAMTTIFHDLMHLTVEDYVDDLLGKSIDRNTHLDILSVVFSCNTLFWKIIFFFTINPKVSELTFSSYMVSKHSIPTLTWH